MGQRDTPRMYMANATSSTDTVIIREEREDMTDEPKPIGRTTRSKVRTTLKAIIICMVASAVNDI